MRNFEEEMGLRFNKRMLDGAKAKEKIEAYTEAFEKGEVERVVYDGIIYAVSYSENPSGRFDQVLLGRIDFIKSLKEYYDGGEMGTLSAESEED